MAGSQAGTMHKPLEYRQKTRYARNAYARSRLKRDVGRLSVYVCVYDVLVCFVYGVTVEETAFCYNRMLM